MDTDKILENQIKMIEDIGTIKGDVGVIKEKQRVFELETKDIKDYIESHPDKCPYEQRKNWKRSTRIGLVSLQIALIVGLLKVVDVILKVLKIF